MSPSIFPFYCTSPGRLKFFHHFRFDRIRLTQNIFYWYFSHQYTCHLLPLHMNVNLTFFWGVCSCYEARDKESTKHVLSIKFTTFVFEIIFSIKNLLSLGFSFHPSFKLNFYWISHTYRECRVCMKINLIPERSTKKVKFIFTSHYTRSLFSMNYTCLVHKGHECCWMRR